VVLENRCITVDNFVEASICLAQWKKL
jgi:hypothetical protein